MDQGGEVARLSAEVAALRIITQRLLGHLASQAPCFEEFLETELMEASRDLSALAVGEGRNYLRHAQLQLQQIHTCQQPRECRIVEKQILIS